MASYCKLCGKDLNEVNHTSWSCDEYTLEEKQLLVAGAMMFAEQFIMADWGNRIENYVSERSLEAGVDRLIYEFAQGMGLSVNGRKLILVLGDDGRIHSVPEDSVKLTIDN